MAFMGRIVQNKATRSQTSSYMSPILRKIKKNLTNQSHFYMLFILSKPQNKLCIVKNYFCISFALSSIQNKTEYSQIILFSVALPLTSASAANI
jgi:hypothetical protein